MRHLRFLITCGLALRVSGALAQAPAVPETPDERRLEEIVVTAGFRERSLAATAGSATVVSADAIEGRAAQHLESVLGLAPNVSYSSGSSRARFVQVRGIGDLEQFVDPKHYPAVGISVDDINLGGTASAAMLFDTEQVEVLRGPQGTRFGTSALAGIVNVQGRQPTRDFEGYLSAGIADYGTQMLGAAVGGPLSEAVSARLAVRQHRSDGYIRNAFLGRDDTNGYDETFARANLRIDTKTDARYEITFLGFDGDNGYDAFSLDNTRTTLSDEPGHDRLASNAIAARGEWPLGEGSTIEAVATWLDSDVEYGFDEDWTFVGICDGTLCDPVFDFFSNTDSYERDRSESTLDLRWLGNRSNARGRAREIVLGFYAQSRDEDLRREYYGPFTSTYATDRRAVYGQVRAELSGRFALTAGYRYERFDDSYGDSFASASATSDELASGELSLAFDVSETSMLYARLSRGEKAGGVNTEASANRPFMRQQFRRFLAPRLRIGTEKLTNAEVGIKASYRDGRIRFSSALFRMDRTDAQLESWLWDAVSYIWVGFLDNVDGDNSGAEAEVSAAVGRRWTISAAVGLLDAKVDAITTFDLDLDDFVERRGIDQAKAPSWQVSFGAEWLSPNGWSARADLESSDASRFGYYHDGTLKKYSLLHASVSRRFGSTELQLWARNLTDEDVYVHGLYFGNDPRKGWVNETYYQFGEPRLVGLSVTYSF